MTAFLFWHRWFAWHPVGTPDRGLVWLRYVWRARCVRNDGRLLWGYVATDEGKRTIHELSNISTRPTR